MSPHRKRTRPLATSRPHSRSRSRTCPHAGTFEPPARSHSHSHTYTPTNTRITALQSQVRTLAHRSHSRGSHSLACTHAGRFQTSVS
eukprot:299164-Rhodomonas_salina.1